MMIPETSVNIYSCVPSSIALTLWINRWKIIIFHLSYYDNILKGLFFKFWTSVQSFFHHFTIDSNTRQHQLFFENNEYSLFALSMQIRIFLIVFLKTKNKQNNSHGKPKSKVNKVLNIQYSLQRANENFILSFKCHFCLFIIHTRNSEL